MSSVVYIFVVKFYTMKYKYTIERLKKAVKNSLSLSQVCRELQIRPVGGNFKTLSLKIKENNIDISHFTGKAWNTGTRFTKFSREYKLEEILVENSPYKSSSKLKNRLIKEGLKDSKCEICKNFKWLNQEIKLEIHHINGINTDNRIENLQVLCPNCHAFTDNYKGKNINKSALSEKKDVEYRKFKETPAEMRGNLEPSPIIREGAETLHGTSKSKNKNKLEKKCAICEKTFKKNNKYCSYECKNIAAAIKIPTYQDLLFAFKIHNSFLQVGKHFNVSDNAVRKWCIRYGILDMMKKKSSAQTE